MPAKFGPASGTETNERMRLPPTRRRVSPALKIFAILFATAVYLDLPTSRQGIPMISAFPFAVIASIIFLPSMFSLRVISLFAFGAIIFLMSLLAPETYRMLPARLLASGQMMYSFFIASTFFLTIRKFSAEQIQNFISKFLIILLIIMILEIFTPLSKLMDDYIAPIYGLDEYISVIRNRDESIGGGFRRPKAFTAETSHVALAYTVSICILGWLSHRQKSLIAPAVLCLLGAFALRSPVTLYGLFFLGICSVKRTAATAADRDDLAPRVLAYTLLAIPVIIVGLYGALEIFAKRLEVLNSGDDYSTTYRTYGSLLAAWATVKEFPLFGVGIGSIDLAEFPIKKTYLSLGVPSWSVMQEWRFQIQNLPSALIIYIGLMGSLLYFLFMRSYIRYLSGNSNIYLTMIILLLAMTTPAFYAPKLNVYFLLLLAINRIWNDGIDSGERPNARWVDDTREQYYEGLHGRLRQRGLKQ